MKKHKKKKTLRKFFFDLPRSKTLWVPINKNLISKDNPIPDTWFQSQHFQSIIKNPLLPLQNFTIDKATSYVRCRKIEIFPNKKQRQILIHWTQIYRTVYNLTVKYFRLHPTAKNNFFDTRKAIRHDYPKIQDWIKMSKIPAHTIDYAIKDVIDAYTSAWSNYKNGNISYFRLKYKKSSSPRHSIVIEESAFSLFKKKNAWKNKMIKMEDKDGSPELYIKYLYGINIEEHYTLPDNTPLENSFCTSVLGNYIKTAESIEMVNKNCRLSYYSRLNAFYLFVPYDKPRQDYQLEDICVLDPGMRTFQTGYTSNDILDLGNKTADIIGYLHREIDRSQAKNNMKKYHQTQRKLKNKIEELHNKIADYLTSTYKCIIIGNVSTKDTTNKKTSNLRKKTKRILLSLGHTIFRTKLASKCEERGVYYEIVDESYTSKTCSMCGNCKNDLGGNKVYKCTNCKVILDRDANACRNILIKNQDRVLCSLEANK